MRAQAHLTRVYGSEEESRTVAGALTVDNEGFVEISRVGRSLEIRAEAESVPQLRRTLEDLLACLATAERTYLSIHPENESSEDEEDSGS